MRSWLVILPALLVALDVSAAAGQQAITRESVVAHYATIVHASYEDTLASARTLRHAIQALVTRPGQTTLDGARKAWLAARERDGQTEAYRFYAGPIDDANGPELRLNGWPIDEAYIDRVKDDPDAGLINNPKVPVTRKQLVALNQRGGEENIATGWHAIEFLLWGQDFNDSGPGNRSFTDFVDGKAPNARRRREYLRVVADLLVDDLAYVTRAWRPDAKNYRSRFVANPSEALRLMITGIGSLARGELAGERLEVALATRDQEDEHSCFSDNTHRDIVANAVGIENVWLGRYRRLDGTLLQGPSLNDLVAIAKPELARQMTADVAASVKAANAIRPPFDQEIRGGENAPGRLRVQAVIEALKRQAGGFLASAGALGITGLNVVDPKRR